MLSVLDEVKKNTRMGMALYLSFLHLIANAIEKNSSQVAVDVSALVVIPHVYQPRGRWESLFPQLNNTLVWGILAKYSMFDLVSDALDRDARSVLAPPEVREWLVKEFLKEKPTNAGVCTQILEVL